MIKLAVQKSNISFSNPTESRLNIKQPQEKNIVNWIELFIYLIWNSVISALWAVLARITQHDSTIWVSNHSTLRMDRFLNNKFRRYHNRYPSHDNFIIVPYLWETKETQFKWVSVFKVITC